MVNGFVRGGAGGNLPAFSVRASSRARSVRLVITAEGDLTVVVPRRFDQRKIAGIVVEKLPWIERTCARVQARRVAAEALAALDDGSAPERVELPALGEVWVVEYRSRSVASALRSTGRSGDEAASAARGRGATVREAAGGRLIVTGADGEDEAARAALVRWLRRRAQKELPARLEELAVAHRLPFGTVTVRHQRTRWGSCTPEHAISLNLRLLFLEPELVDHVLIHELCHTRELNHSKRFWALMQMHDPDWKTHRRRTREVWRTLPRWLHAGPGGPEL